MTELKLNHLNDTLKSKIRELEQSCRNYENLKREVYLSSELNFNRTIDCFYLLYDGEQLVSFLSLFLPMAEEAEVSAYTLPKHRNKGCFHRLLQIAETELSKYAITKILFVVEPGGKDALGILPLLRAGYAYSEYLMTYDFGHSESFQSRLRLQTAKPENLPEMAVLDSKLFEEDYEESLSLLTKSLESGQTKAYCAFLGNKIIGLCNVSLQDGKISIYGIGVSPEYQGRGYGRELLNQLLELVAQMKPEEITLEVSSTNTAAYRLYLSSGFTIKSQYDYYSYPIN